MAVSRGKPFEKKVEEQLDILDNITVERLHDQMSGYVNVSKNPSDYILYRFPYMMYLECKSIRGASIPVTDLPQLERIKKRCVKNPNVKGYFIIWFIDHECTFWIDYKYLDDKVEKEGWKSFNYQVLLHESKNNELVKLIPATYPRIYGVYDFEEVLPKCPKCLQ